jgi:Holliday junction DNA helicase RuvA
MLSRLCAILERADDEGALLVMPGAHAGTSQAFDVLAPAYLRDWLAGRVGQIVTLHTIQSLESPDGGSSFTPRLIGFSTPDERRFFELLTTVKGVGTKKALKALASPVGDVARAITLRDATALAKLPGIGKRLAETIIAELHGKVEAFASAMVADPDRPGQTRPAGPEAAEPFRRAVAALVRLGESEADAQRLVRRAMEEDATAKSADELVSAALAAR